MQPTVYTQQHDIIRGRNLRAASEKRQHSERRFDTTLRIIGPLVPILQARTGALDTVNATIVANSSSSGILKLEKSFEVILTDVEGKTPKLDEHVSHEVR